MPILILSAHPNTSTTNKICRQFVSACTADLYQNDGDSDHDAFNIHIYYNYQDPASSGLYMVQIDF